MQPKRIWTIQSFLTCFLLNAIVFAAFYYGSRQVLQGIHQWVDPLLAGGAEGMSEDVRLALRNLTDFVKEIELYLAPVVFGLGALGSLILWLFIMLQGRALVRHSMAEHGGASAVASKPREKKVVKEEKAEPSPAESPYVQASPQSAIQMLAILQREGRLIDFLQEDLGMYDDAQIGAAVRSIHQGCKGAIAEHVELEPIFKEEEGIEVTVPAGFDPRAIRLTGNVAGDPPFKGALRHRGWRITRVELPQSGLEQKKDWILAPAEVEME